MLGCSGGSVKMPVVIAHQRPLALLVLPGQTLQHIAMYFDPEGPHCIGESVGQCVQVHSYGFKA